MFGATVAATLLLDSTTTAPPAGAAALSVTVPCEELPPVILVGLSVIDVSEITGCPMLKTRFAPDEAF
jgi:hypothetical protein